MLRKLDEDTHWWVLGTDIADRSDRKARNAFARLNTETVGSNPIWGMDVCFYSVSVLSYVGSGFATSRSHPSRNRPNCL
jgi:hypothetical protein